MSRFTFMVAYCAGVTAFFLALYGIRFDLSGHGFAETVVAIVSFPGLQVAARFPGTHDERFFAYAAAYNIAFYSGIVVFADVIAASIERRRGNQDS